MVSRLSGRKKVKKIVKNEEEIAKFCKKSFMQLGFNLSNGTLESSSILIYFETHESIYTQHIG